MHGPFIITPQDGLYKVKLTFFDRDRVRKALDERTHKFLSKFGAYTRSDAKRSMKKRKSAAPPYRPPSVHEGSLKKFLYFAYEPIRRSVVIGPVKLSKKNIFGNRIALGMNPNDINSPDAMEGNAPEVLEYGGQGIARKNPRRVVRAIGDYGAIRIGGSTSDSARLVKNYRGKHVYVTFARIKSEKMLKRVNAVESEVWGSLYWNSDMLPRPYMGPAMEKNLKEIDRIWKGI